MSARCAVLLFFSAGFVFGQQSAPPVHPAASATSTAAPCGNGPIDEYLAAKNKARRVRNKNPLPSNLCVGSWCKSIPNGPSEKPPNPNHPQDTPPSAEPSTTESSSNESSSKEAPGPTCDIYTAVQDVEVADFYYEKKNYRAALGRYESALQSKPGDPAIFLRLGKTAEKLGDNERAKREYQSSIDAGPDSPSAKESKDALSHLASKSAK